VGGWEDLRVGELLDLAERLGPGGAAGLVLWEAESRDGFCQRDRARLAGLWVAQGRWSEARAALVLGEACQDADERERAKEGGVVPARSLTAETALLGGLTDWDAGRLARVGRGGLEHPVLGRALGAVSAVA
jgi:hypothetical protein